MKKHLLTAAALAVCMAGYSQSQAPGAIVSSGGSGQTGAAALSWTVGEPFVGTLTTAEGSLVQGLSAPSQALPTAVAGPEAGQSVAVYPNPVNSRLRIEVPAAGTGLLLRLVDALGREWLSETVAAGARRDIDVSALPNGAYYLQVLETGRSSIKTVKIIKAK